MMWERLLVHATALGVANKVINAMNVIIPNYKTNPTLRMYTDIAVSLPSITRNTIHSYTKCSSSGGFGGGVGGGGGSGGAR